MKKDLDTLLRSHVRDASRLLAELAAGVPLPTFEREAWERGDDEHFRRRPLLTPDATIILFKHEEKFKALPSYKNCVDSLYADPDIGPQLGKLVGGEHLMQIRIDVDNLIRSLIFAMVDESGNIKFDNEQFNAEWQRITELFLAEMVPYITIAPLPGFSATKLPIEIGAGLVIDSLTDEEMNRCLTTRIIQPFPTQFPLVGPEYAVGVRFSTSVKKVVYDGSERREKLSTGPGAFGNRSVPYVANIVDDVLSALRLLKAGHVWCPGSVAFSPTWFLDGGMSFWSRPGSRFHFGKYNVSEAEALELGNLWRTLTSRLLEQKPFLDSSLRRLNFALDRFRAEDELVDLLIAAESLFLSDVGSPAGRGELRFRLALRAGKFVQHINLSQPEVYDLMRKAYDVRSEVVHSGRVSTKMLNSLPNSSLEQFSDAVEEVIRLGLRKAIDVASADQHFGTSTYWVNLLFAR